MQDVRDNKLFSNISTIGGGLLILLVIGLIVYLSLERGGYFLNRKNRDKNHITSSKYICEDNKTLIADFFENKSETSSSTNVSDSEDTTDGKNTPTVSRGFLVLRLDDGRNFELNETIYADGARYSNKDQSFVFLDKDQEAMILEFDTEKSYRGCKKYDPIENGYTDLTSYNNLNFDLSVSYPKSYILDEKYKYTNLGPGKDIDGVKFTIPKIYTDGNNLSQDSYISIESISDYKSCDASLFLANSIHKNLFDNGIDYSYAFQSDAAAGNRYEESVYAFPKNNKCFAVRYFIHYGAIENYNEVKVKSFNKENLIKEFDLIRDSFSFSN